MKRIPVKSSNIASIGYDPKTRILELEFRNSRIYQYEGVEKAAHADLMHAPSVGKFFFERIKGQYDEHEVTEPQTEAMKGTVS